MNKEIQKRADLMSKMLEARKNGKRIIPEKRNIKQDALEKKFKTEYKGYFDRLVEKRLKKEQPEQPAAKKPMTEGVMVSPAAFNKQGRMTNSSVREMKSSALFDGSVQEIMEKLSKITENKKNPVFVDRIKSDAKKSLANIISEQLSNKSSDQKVIAGAMDAISKIDSKEPLKEKVESKVSTEKEPLKEQLETSELDSIDFDNKYKRLTSNIK